MKKKKLRITVADDEAIQRNVLANIIQKYVSSQRLLPVVMEMKYMIF